MKNIKVFILLAALIICGKNGKLFGQTSPAATFDCSTSGMILTQGDGTSKTAFIHINTSSNPFTFDTLFVVNYNLNSTAYNPLDNYMYAFPTGTDTTMLRIDANGGIDVISTDVASTVAPNNLPANDSYKGGTFDNKGNYFLAPSAGNNANSQDNAIFYINMSNPSTQYRLGLGSGNNVDLADIAWNPVDGKLYGIESSTYAPNSGNLGKLTVITLTYNASGIPTAATMARVGSTSSLYSFGAMYMGDNGAIYGSLNDGGFYQFNIDTGARTKISGSPSSTTNDGANCPLNAIAFGADIQITKTDNTTLLAPGTTHTYTITVSNPGPFGAEGIVVSDTLPAGIPAANVSYTATVVNGPNSAVATTTITGAKIGALNDTISLEVGSSVTYTVKLTVPANYKSYVLTNYALATPSNSTIDPDTSNNEAQDTDRTPIIPVNPHVRGRMKQ